MDKWNDYAAFCKKKLWNKKIDYFFSEINSEKSQIWAEKNDLCNFKFKKCINFDETCKEVIPIHTVLEFKKS